MEGKKTIRLTISRWDPEKDKAPCLETHLVPHDEGMTILDALFHVYENIDRSLGFNFGCRYGRCGICAVNVNGKPTLICQTLALPEMVIEPLPNYPVVRDLIIERAEFGDRTAALHPFLERESQPAQEGMMPEVLNPKDFDTFVKATRCVDCFSCNSICPVITEIQESNRGPNLMMQMAPYLFDPRDSGKRTEILDQLAKGNMDVADEDRVQTGELLELNTLPIRSSDDLDPVRWAGRPNADPEPAPGARTRRGVVLTLMAALLLFAGASGWWLLRDQAAGKTTAWPGQTPSAPPRAPAAAPKRIVTPSESVRSGTAPDAPGVAR